MRAGIVAGLLASVTLECGVEPVPEPARAEFAELCGQDEPVRLLAFEPWRSIEWAARWDSFAGRELAWVSYADTLTSRFAVWSMGPCGEAPRQLYVGSSNLWRFEPYDLPFVCDNELRQFYVLDPSGERPPHAVFTAVPGLCSAQASEVGLALLRPDADQSETGELILQAWPGDPWIDEVAPEVLLAGVKTEFAAANERPWDALAIDGADAFVLTDADELVRVSLIDGELEPIATGVWSFRLGFASSVDAGDEAERRYLLWQTTALLADDVAGPEGELVLLDRSTGEQTSLGQGALAPTGGFGPRWWVGEPTRDYVGVIQRVDGQLRLRVHRLPSLEFTDLAATLEPAYLLADARHLAVVAPGDRGSFTILDLDSGEAKALGGYSDHRFSAATGTLGLVRGDALWLLRDGGEPELAADRSSEFHQLMTDGRVLSSVGLDPYGLGELIVSDPDSFEERLLDRDVHSSSVRLHERDDGERISYAILDGERAGLWHARLRPRE